MAGSEGVPALSARIKVWAFIRFSYRSILSNHHLTLQVYPYSYQHRHTTRPT